MPFPAAAAIAAGGELLGGLLGSTSASKQNAQERMWQEHMASTQYQRAVKDMRAAGLNPAMIYGHGGMSEGVSGGARQSVGEPLARGVGSAGSSAVQAQYMQAQLEQVHSATKLTEAQTEAVKLENDIKSYTFSGESYIPGFKWKPDAILPGGLDLEASFSPNTKGRQLAAQRVVEILRGKAQISDIGSGIAAREVGNTLTAIQSRLAELGIPKEAAMAALYKQYGDKLAGAKGLGEVLQVLKVILDMLK
ncbi:MAG: DNA pilot protein [Microvirus sp.]|nr:MAG: DNA pilot protein [Microvirus sp.]